MLGLLNTRTVAARLGIGRPTVTRLAEYRLLARRRTPLGVRYAEADVECLAAAIDVRALGAARRQAQDDARHIRPATAVRHAYCNLLDDLIADASDLLPLKAHASEIETKASIGTPSHPAGSTH